MQAVSKLSDAILFNRFKSLTSYIKDRNTDDTDSADN